MTATSKKQDSRCGVSWTRKGKNHVLKEILRRERDCLPLNSSAVRRKDRGLYAAVRTLFVSWDDAMRTAGIDPATVRKSRPWSRESIILRIKELARQGKNVSSHSEATLAVAASSRFSSWDEALRCAGINPEDQRKRVPTWTRKSVIQAIREIRAAGGKLGHAALKGNSVTHAAKLLFGSWDGALRAAGLDPNTIRLHRCPWTAEAIMREIRRKSRLGEPLNAASVEPYSLRERATQLFGSWDGALAASGLNPAGVRKIGPRGIVGVAIGPLSRRVKR